MPHNADRTEWTNEIPTLRDLDQMAKGGLPGCEYLYCDSAHEGDAQRQGWVRLGSTVLWLTGPRGTVAFVVMKRGKAVKGMAPDSAQPPLNITCYLLEGTGLGESDSPLLAPEGVVELPPEEPTLAPTLPTDTFSPITTV